MSENQKTKQTKYHPLNVFDFVRVETKSNNVYHGEIYSVSPSGIEIQAGRGRQNLHWVAWSYIERIVGVDSKDLTFNGVEYEIS